MSRRRGGASPGTIGHEVRTGRDADDVMARAKPGDVVVLDRMDLEPELARGLIARGVHAVVNAQPALSGRFPSSGSLLLVRADVVLIDAVGPAIAELRDGERVRVLDNRVLRGDRVLVEGRRRSDSDLVAELDQVRAAGGAMVRAEALVADAVGILRSAPGIVDGTAADPALVHCIDGRACIVIAEDPAPSDRAWLKRAAVDRTWAVIAAGESTGAALIASGIAVDAVIGVQGASVPLADGPGDAGPLRADAVMAGPDLEAAVVTALVAGAPVVVPLGATAHDLIEALDQPRGTSAASAVARMVGSGRVVHVETMRALGRAAPIEPPSGRRAARRTRPGWVVPAAVAALALIAGLAVGTGPGANWWGGNDELVQAQAGLTAFQERAATLGTEVAQGDAVAASLQQQLVEGRLDGRRLVLVVGPGMPDDVTVGTRSVVEQAGGTWTGTVTVTDTYVDPDRATSLDDIALRLAPTETEFPATGAPGVRRDAALAASVVRQGGDRAASSAAEGYLAALGQVGAVEVDGAPQARAALAVLLVPPGTPGATSEALISLGKALGASGGVVVATPGGAATSSTLTALRSAAPPAPQVSTVDGAARAWGRIGVVNASQAAFGGTFGAYGPEAVLSNVVEGGSTPTPTATG